MPNYRRVWRPGGTFFFTLTLLDRRTDLLVRHIEALREAVRVTKAQRPFDIDAWVVLPEHMHWIITLPDGDADYANRIKAMKIRFVRAIPRGETRNPARVSRGERGIWQRRFWEHEIRDEADFARHVDYIHFNPVKHGWVTRVRDWPYSTFHRYVERGVLASDWGGDAGEFDAGER
ncbi:MAG: transposase [Chromatiales bacterium]|nr:transposase [Gammaproteobacteria bacterium]MCP5352645.1 transposase [Chromatiales bacterium]